MKIARKITWVLLILLGLSTGLVKVMGQPDDVRIFAGLGFTYSMTVAFGALQALAALALLPKRTMNMAAWVLAVSFVVATVGLFVDDKPVFGAVSVLFIVMAVLQATSTQGNLFPTKTTSA